MAKKRRTGKGEGEGVAHLKVRLGPSSFYRTIVARGVPKSDASSAIATETETERRERTVVLAGVPAGASVAGLKSAFSAFGAVEGCVIHKDRSKGTAIVVFERVKSRDAVLSERAERASLCLGDEDGPRREGAFGLLLDYRRERPGNAVLLQRANDYIEHREAEEDAERRAREAAAAGDGWTVVTTRKGARHKNQDGTGVNLGAVSKVKAEANRKEAFLHQGFYHFQRREQRRNEILELQDKFKEDKRRIAELRGKRKFNPYHQL